MVEVPYNVRTRITRFLTPVIFFSFLLTFLLFPVSPKRIRCERRTDRLPLIFLETPCSHCRSLLCSFLASFARSCCCRNEPYAPGSMNGSGSRTRVHREARRSRRDASVGSGKNRIPRKEQERTKVDAKATLDKKQKRRKICGIRFHGRLLRLPSRSVTLAVRSFCVRGQNL